MVSRERRENEADAVERQQPAPGQNVGPGATRTKQAPGMKVPRGDIRTHRGDVSGPVDDSRPATKNPIAGADRDACEHHRPRTAKTMGGPGTRGHAVSGSRRVIRRSGL